MIDFKLQCSELYEFIKIRECNNKLATVCSREEAEYVIDGETPLFFKFVSYSEEKINFIRKQMAGWNVKCVHTEEWDPSFGNTHGRSTHDSTVDIRLNKILVQDGNFIGIVDYSKNLTGKYGMSFARIADYNGEPLLFSHWEDYGSSDHDMISIKQYYLVRK